MTWQVKLKDEKLGKIFLRFLGVSNLFVEKHESVLVK